MADEHRRRITLFEVLVVACTLFGLACLLLPSITPAHEAARRATCTGNASQLARANLIRATSNNGAIAGYLEPLHELDKAKDNAESQGVKTIIAVAWPTKLLPVIEEATLHQKIIDSSADDASLFAQPPATGIFLCPSDSQLEAAPGGLSYVVNSGMPDLISPSESQPSDLKANGVCHDQRPGRFGPQVRLGRDLKDGASRTILLSENIHRDPPGSASQPGNTWLRPAAGATNLEQWYGMVWVVDPQHPRSPQAALLDRFNRDTRPESQRDQPYAASGTRFARPASNHPDVFIVAFCEGNTRTISQDIDYAVYQQLMTPDGQKAAPADAPNQRFEKTLPDDERFMNPTLTDADY